MTTNQHSKKLIPQIGAELRAVRSEAKFDACKPFFEPISDHWIDHCNTTHDKIADSASLKLKSEHLEIPADLWWQAPQMPLRLLACCDIAMVDVDATVTLAFETVSARLMTHYTLAESNSSNSRVQHQKPAALPDHPPSSCLKKPK